MRRLHTEHDIPLVAPPRYRQIELFHRPLMKEDRVELCDVIEERSVRGEVTVGHGTVVLYEGIAAAAESVLFASVGLVPIEDVFRGVGVIFCCRWKS